MAYFGEYVELIILKDENNNGKSNYILPIADTRDNNFDVRHSLIYFPRVLIIRALSIFSDGRVKAWVPHAEPLS